MLAFDDLLETADRLGHRHVLAVAAGELRRHEERLRQEALQLARARHRHLVFFRQLVDAQNGDDVLKVLVALQHALHFLRHAIVLVADDARVENARGGR